ncbi:MAG TPA: hypothetical protein VK438_04495 [Xanthobacteraceae bacterium]|nr:hypothetical protein [Xanthobacteraceae bacterium]
MPTKYRLHTISPDGRFVDRVDLDCDTDEQAVEMAKARLGAYRLEVWSGARLVREITPGAEVSAPQSRETSEA